MIAIRAEAPADAESVRDINLRAFGGPDEADLVDRLRLSCAEAISLVSEWDGRLVGHILFSPVVIENGDRRISGMGLAPMAVAPDFQRRGIGTKLVQSGLKAVRDVGYAFVVVVGHPEYYPRFGFVRASTHGVTCEFDVPDEAFLILPLDDSLSPELNGVAKYRSEFEVWK